MAETQFASIDSTTMYSPNTEYKPDSANLARRSLSIFSRRGTETPDAQPHFAVPMPVRQPRPMSEKQKDWIERSKSTKSNLNGLSHSRNPSASETRCSSPTLGRSLSKRLSTSSMKKKKVKGTILNAVPPARTIAPMTALEEEMAVSPNEEIMSAISGKGFFSTGSDELPSQNSPWQISSPSMTQRTTSVRRREKNSRIGVWVDGVVHWDPEVAALQKDPTVIEEETGFAPIRGNVRRLSRKPRLSVIIPRDDAYRIRRRAPIAVVPQLLQESEPVLPVVTVQSAASQTPHEPRLSNEFTPASLNAEGPSTGPTSSKSPYARSLGSHPSSSCDSLHDIASACTKQSSATSLDGTHITTPPRSAGKQSVNGLDKPLPPPPTFDIECDSPVMAPRPVISNRRLSRSLHLPDKRYRPRALKPTRSITRLDLLDRAALPGPLSSNPVVIASPTLSQAERDLHFHLSDLFVDDDDQPVEEQIAISRKSSVRSVMVPPQRAPTLPRRSRKRDWRVVRKSRYSNGVNVLPRLVRRKTESAATCEKLLPDRMMRRSRSLYDFPPMPEVTLEPELPERHPDHTLASRQSLDRPMPIVDDGLIVVHGPIRTRRMTNKEAEAVSAAAAESVLLKILSCLETVEDLVNTAVINKGMYRVYKDNQAHLLRTVARNQSGAMWELQEWDMSAEGAKSAAEYLQVNRRNAAMVAELKSSIQDQCQASMRAESCLGFVPSQPYARNLDDALYRIWTFCKIFGCDKGREDDVVGQLDWLKGGLLANNERCAATVNVNLEFDMTSVLLNVPDHFAVGNAGGLSASQLLDILELWTGVTSLLQGYLGEVDQARAVGVFDGTNVIPGDTKHEEKVLEEWTSYLLTLGPSVILAMAEHAEEDTSKGFALAKQNGWTKWSLPLYNGSRNSFLREPVTRMYEELLATTQYHPIEKQDDSSKRVAALAVEIRLRRQSSTIYESAPRHQRRRTLTVDENAINPRITISSPEHKPTSLRRSTAIPSRTPSSSSATSASNLRPRSRSGLRPTSPRSYTTSPSNSPNLTTRTPPLSASATMSQHTYSSTPSPISSSSTPTSATHQRASSPRRCISPIIEDRVTTFNRLSLKHFAEGIAEDTSTRAIAKIVAEGFSEEQAKEALRVTDLGDGLRVDRAVDLLVRWRRDCAV